MLGQHLMLDMYDCNGKRLDDPNFILSILDELPELIGMHKLSTPIVNHYDEPSPGFSGFVIISESHISIHTFVGEKFASVDIFSCGNFDIDKAINYLTNALEATKLEKNLVNRGKDFPRDIILAKSIVNRQRNSIGNKH